MVVTLELKMSEAGIRRMLYILELAGDKLKDREEQNFAEYKSCCILIGKLKKKINEATNEYKDEVL